MKTCWNADTGSSSSNQKCIFTCCAQTYCSTGAQFSFNLLIGCACVASVCQSSCNSSGDYCGGGAPNVTTQACSDCLTAATGAGAVCDESAGSSLDQQCSANAGCAAYNTCANGCP